MKTAALLEALLQALQGKDESAPSGRLAGFLAHLSDRVTPQEVDLRAPAKA